MRSEYVVAVVGEVAKRSGAVNDKICDRGDRGDPEVNCRILSEAETPPFPIEENSKTKEEVRLKYRYLDLRRAGSSEKSDDEKSSDDIDKTVFLRGRIS